MSVELTHFFQRIENNREERSFSKQSYSEARLKMKHDAYIELNDDLVKAYYANNTYKTYKGYRLVAIDGSRIQLPNTTEVIEEFGIAENKGKSIAMAMTSVSYDVLNNIVIAAYVDRYEASERKLAEYHIKKKREDTPKIKDIKLLDRGYPSVYLYAKMLVFGDNFVVRCNAEYLKEVKAFAHSTATDQIIEIDLRTSERMRNTSLQQLVQEHSLPILRLRIVKIVLDNGTTEYLLTSLLDQEIFSVDDLKRIYAYACFASFAVERRNIF